jgi:hypothetical protein
MTVELVRMVLIYALFYSIETKELKKRVRDLIQPDRDLGHVDGKKSSVLPPSPDPPPPSPTPSPLPTAIEASRETEVEQKSLPIVKAKEASDGGSVCKECV